jgi:hypothetical protein
MSDKTIAEDALDSLDKPLSEFLAYADLHDSVPDDSDLRILSLLAEKLVQKTKELDERKKEVEALQLELRQLSEKDIPDKLFELGISSFRLADGTEISTRPEVYCGISEMNREKAFTWLTENGYADLIKNVVSVSLGRGENEIAEQLASAAADLGLTAEQKKTVHPQTLKAWIKERDERNVPIPDELFSVYRVNKARIK